MTAFMRELLAVERSRITVRAGASGPVLLGAFAAAMVIVGPVAMAAAGDAAETAFDRLVATVSGVAIAFVVLGLVDAPGRTERLAG